MEEEEEEEAADPASLKSYFPDEFWDLPLPITCNEEEWYDMIVSLGPLNNGIYCLFTYREFFDDVGYENRVSIMSGKTGLCNPSTNCYKFANSFPEDDYARLTDLANKPSRVHYGFGTTTEGEYKAVLIVTWGPLFSSFLSYVYNFRRGEWRKIIDYEHGMRNNYRDINATEGLIIKKEDGELKEEIQCGEITPDLEVCPQRFYKGCWHWMSNMENGNCSVLSFNINEEVFKYMNVPQVEGNIDESTVSVLVLKDHLGAILFPESCLFVHVWMMMEYGVEESWTMIYAIQPNYPGVFTRLVGICWQLNEDGEDDANSHVIDYISFEDSYTDDLIDCDAYGYHRVVKDLSVGDLSESLHLSVIGI